MNARSEPTKKSQRQAEIQSGSKLGSAAGTTFTDARISSMRAEADRADDEFARLAAARSGAAARQAGPARKKDWPF